MFKSNQIAAAVGFVMGCMGLNTSWANTAGRVLMAAGEVFAERDGQQVRLIRGTEVLVGDLLVAGQNSSLQVRFADESLASLRSNSRLRVEAFDYKQNASSDQMVIGLVKGGLRTITGAIGRANQEKFLLRTSTATVGIRGTHFTALDCQDDCTNIDGSNVQNGTYGGVSDGSIGVTTNAGEQVFNQQDYFFVPDANTLPQPLLLPPAVLSDRNLLARGKSGAQTSSMADAGDASEDTSGSTSTTTTPANTLGTTISVSTGVNSLFQTAFEQRPEQKGISGVRLSGNRSTIENISGNADVGGQWNSLIIQELGSGNTASLLAAAIDRSSAESQVGGGGFSSTSSFSGGYLFYDFPGETIRTRGHFAFGDPVAISLPTSGTATYSLTGQNPATDNFNRIGSFSGSDINFNFGTQTGTNTGEMTFFYPEGNGQTATRYLIGASSLNIGSTPSISNNVVCVQGCAAGSTTQITTAGVLAGTQANLYLTAYRIGTTALVSGAAHVAGMATIHARTSPLPTALSPSSVGTTGVLLNPLRP